MSIAITTDTDLFPKEGFCPGAGVLAVHVPDAYDFSSHSLEEAVKRSIPPCTSFGRPPMQFTRRVQALLYSNIRAAVNSLFDAWGEHVSRREKAPVVNHTYMEKWFERMHLNREEVMAQMGVAQPGDTIDLCTTQRGGRKVIISTFENGYAEVFRRRMDAAPGKAAGAVGEHGDSLFDIDNHRGNRIYKCKRISSVILACFSYEARVKCGVVRYQGSISDKIKKTSNCIFCFRSILNHFVCYSRKGCNVLGNMLLGIYKRAEYLEHFIILNSYSANFRYLAR